MWELVYDESWAPKNWCFWTAVLEKTLESPLDCKENQVHSKGDQPWDFFGRNDAKAETPVLWPPHAKSWLIGKASDAGRDWGQEDKGTTEDEMAGWHHWLNGRGSEWTPGVGDGQGGLECCDSWGRKESDWATELNWTDLSAHSPSTWNSPNFPLKFSYRYPCGSLLHLLKVFAQMSSQWDVFWSNQLNCKVSPTLLNIITFFLQYLSPVNILYISFNYFIYYLTSILEYMPQEVRYLCLYFSSPNSTTLTPLIFSPVSRIVSVPGSSNGEESACNTRTAAHKSFQSCLTLCDPIDGSPPGSPVPGFNHCLRKIAWIREWLPTPLFLPGDFHGWRNFAGNSPWVRKVSDMTE